LRERIRYLCRASLLIIDEIGYLTVRAGAGNLFFQLVNARYERGAMILTSNRGFAEWGKVFGDPVVARPVPPTCMCIGGRCSLALRRNNHLPGGGSIGRRAGAHRHGESAAPTPQ
jgi:hypothetical protein